LAQTLTQTNRFRQDMTSESYTHAQGLVDENNLPNLIIVADTSYDEGIIGLIAGKLLEKYHRPALAIAIGETTSKGSARSLPGFNITDHLRSFSDLLLSIGGHAGAAGFSLNNQSLDIFISAASHPKIDPKLFVSSRRIDAAIPLSTINEQLITRLNEFEPFGLGNPRPVFSSSNIQISGLRYVGKENKHLKFSAENIEAIWFNAPLSTERLALSPVDLIYQVNENTYNGYTTPQLIIQDITPHASST
jgi:single-stranded-DNA-specific exonuclease